MLVKKRSGELQELNLVKIKNVVNWATKGFDIEPLELESNLQTVFREGIETKEINENMIFSALRLASGENPDWLKVAGRLKYRDLRDKVEKKRGYRQGEFLNHIYYHVGEGVYDGIINSLYTYDEIEGIGEFLVNDRDLLYDFTGINQLEQRYLLSSELPQECFLVIAMFICQGYTDDRLTKIRKVYDLISLNKLSLASPILANLRKPDANLSSCFILGVNDDLGSIYEGVKDTAFISKNGGGVGVNFSHVRARGAMVNGNENASKGVVPFIKVFNDTAVAVNQNGKRAGAVTVSLDIWHLDILEFLEMQSENGDLRLKAYDVFPQLVIPDYFMEMVRSDGNWLLFDPYEVNKVFDFDFPSLWGDDFLSAYSYVCENYEGKLKNFIWVKAKDLFKGIIKSLIETGLPYLFFKDTVNRLNPNKDSGYIPCANLCVESFSNVLPDKETHVCNLISINLSNVTDLEYENVMSWAVEILDNCIDISTPPTESAKAHNNLYRTIGVGYMGLADWLAVRGFNYSTGKRLIFNLFDKLAYFGIKRSMELAITRGAYPEFSNSEWAKGKILGRELCWFLENSDLGHKWAELSELIKLNGIRNGQIFAIAPNTSSSLIQGCTASVLPPYKLFFMDSNSKGSNPISVPYLKSKRWYYVENRNTNQMELVETIGKCIAPFVDSGISMELVFNGENPNVNSKFIAETIFKAWESGNKTIYYVRLTEEETVSECFSCSN